MKIKVLLAATMLVTYSATHAQSLSVPGGSGAITNSGGAGSGIGISVNPLSPITPISGYLDVETDVRLNGSGSSDGVFFASPNAEKGMSIVRNSFSNRADIRFDGDILRVLVGPSGAPPASTNGISIANNGNIGIGINAPNSQTKVWTNTSQTDISNGVTTGIFSVIQSTVGQPASEAKAIYGSALSNSITSGINIGVKGKSTNGNWGHGGYFEADDATYTRGLTSIGRGLNGPSTLCHGGYFSAIYGNTVIGIEAVGSGSISNSTQYNYGVKAKGVMADNGQENYGIHTFADARGNVQKNYGIYSKAEVADQGNLNYGLYTHAKSPDQNLVNYGTYSIAEAAGNLNATNYGIYATISGGMPGNMIGVGSFAGYFEASGPGNGAGFFNGDVWRTGADNFASDEKFKKKIEPVNNALELIMQLEAKSYIFKGKDEYPSFNFPSGKQYGFIAQEIEKIIPEVVNEGINPVQYDKDGNKIADAVTFKGVEYVELIPILTASIQEQQKIINALNERIEKLEREQNGIGDSHDEYNQDKFDLSQNVPNPFNGYTSIGYKFPNTYSDAYIVIVSSNGNIIKNIPLQDNSGQVSISGQDFSSGVYLYSLVLNGRTFITKRMTVNK